MAATPHADQQISQWEYFKGVSAAQRGQETNLSQTGKPSLANIHFPN